MTKYKYLLLPAALLIVLSACMTEVGQDKTSDPALGEIQNEVAEKLYRKNCRLCHGKDGQKMLGGASDLSLSELDKESRIAVIKEGRGNMAPFGDKLSTVEVESLANYLEGLVAE